MHPFCNCITVPKKRLAQDSADMSEQDAKNEDPKAGGPSDVDFAALSTAVLAAVIDPTMVIGADGIIVYFNPAACEAFGVTSETAIGSNITKFMGEEKHVHQHDTYLKNYLQTGQKKMIGRNRTVMAKRCDNGATWHASLSISEVMLQNKRFFVGTLRDVTQHLKREKLFKSVIDEAIDAIFTINEKGIITLVNQSALSMFGYTQEELVGKNVSILMPDSHRKRHDSYIAQHMATGIQKMIGTDRTVTARRKDNSEFKCRLGLSKIEDDQLSGGPAGGGGGVTFVGLLHDLTHEMAARDADARAELANKMRQQKSLVRSSPCSRTCRCPSLLTRSCKCTYML